MLEREKSFTEIYCIQLIKHLYESIIYLSITSTLKINYNTAKNPIIGNLYTIYIQLHDCVQIYTQLQYAIYQSTSYSKM